MQNDVNILNEDEDEIDILDLLRAILRKWYLIIIVALLCGAMGFLIATYFVVPTYESTSELYVLSKSTSITSLADIQMGTSLTNDYMVVVSGRPVLDSVAAKLNLNESYEELSERVSLTNPSNTRILNITVTDTDPAQAKAIADAIADEAAAFIAEKMDQDAPSVIQYGYIDYQRTNGGRVKYTGIGGLAGAFLVIIIVIIFYFINDTIISSDDVEHKLGLKVIAQIPLDDSLNDKKGLTKKKLKRKKKEKEPKKPKVKKEVKNKKEKRY